MFCQSSEEGPYFDTFGKVTAYDEAVSGQLTFTLNDGGEMIFHKAGQKLEFENADNEVTQQPQQNNLKTQTIRLGFFRFTLSC
jgi:hypothetical protein